MKIKSSAILFMTHKINSFIFSQYYTIKKDIEDKYDLFMLVDEAQVNLEHIPDDIRYYPFSIESLNKLEYIPIEKTIVPGSNHFPVLQFYRDYPDYNYYWNIEYDVYFNGQWNTLFKKFKNMKIDFISSHIEYYHERPHWYWWNTLIFRSIYVEKSKLLKSFNPIYRISNPALKFLDKFLQEKNSGHHETLIPTILYSSNFSLLDFGGYGSFSSKLSSHKYYKSPKKMNDYYEGSTMKYRPILSSSKIKNLTEINCLYHPVKE